MSNGSTTVYHEMARLLGDELATNAALVASTTLSLEKFGETLTIARLRFLSDLKETLGLNGHPYAVGLLMGLPKLDRNWQATLAEHKLDALESDLTYVKPIQADVHTFRRAKDLWNDEIERLTLAPDYVQLVFIATLVTRILNRDWHNFLQQQQLVDRAKLAAAVLGKNSDAIATWVRVLDATIKESYKGNAPARGELSFSLN